MKPAKFSSLEDKIIRPGIEKHLTPLTRFRGSGDLGRIHRMWNFTISCMEQEVESYTQAVKLAHNPDYSHLCGPRRPVQISALYGWFGRLLDSPNVTDNISGLTSYVRDIPGRKFKLSQVSEFVRWDGPAHIARKRPLPWRILRIRTHRTGTELSVDGHSLPIIDGFIHITVGEFLDHPVWSKHDEIQRPKIRRGRPRSALKLVEPKERRVELFYPYLVHDPAKRSEGEQLVIDINNAVPKHLPDYLRADICQDMVVAILSGELSRGAINDRAAEYVRGIQRMHPTKFAPVSLDAPVPGTENLAWAEVI